MDGPRPARHALIASPSLWRLTLPAASPRTLSTPSTRCCRFTFDLIIDRQPKTQTKKDTYPLVVCVRLMVRGVGVHRQGRSTKSWRSQFMLLRLSLWRRLSPSRLSSKINCLIRRIKQRHRKSVVSFSCFLFEENAVVLFEENETLLLWQKKKSSNLFIFWIHFS